MKTLSVISFLFLFTTLTYSQNITHEWTASLGGNGSEDLSFGLTYDAAGNSYLTDQEAVPSSALAK